MKLLDNTLLISCGLFLASQMSFAQSANIYFGQGTAIDNSANTLIDTFGTGKPFTTPRMGGSFSDAGASILFLSVFIGIHRRLNAFSATPWHPTLNSASYSC